MNTGHVTILSSRVGDPNFPDQPFSTISFISQTHAFNT